MIWILQALLGDDKDTSETITGYTITSTDDLSGFTFSAGTYDAATNTLTLDPADLADLQVTPPTDYVGSVDLEVTVFNAETNLSDEEFDSSDNTNTATDTFTLTWVNGPVITYNFSSEVDGDSGLVKEDSSVTLNLDVDNIDPVGPVAGDEVLSITISDLETSWDIDLAGQSGSEWVETSPGTYTITLPAGESYEGEITFTPPVDSDLDHPTFTITASVTDPVLEITQTATATVDIVTDAVIDTPTLTVLDANVEESKTVALDISAAIGETGENISETITEITLSGLPEGATLNNGTFNAVTQTWTLTLDDLSALEVTIPDGVTGEFDVVVSVTSAENVTEGDDGNQEVDFTDNVATVVQTIKLTVTKDGVPTAQPVPVTVDENNFPGKLTQNGDLNIDFGDDSEGATIEPKEGVLPEGLTSSGQDVSVTIDGNVYTATNEDDDVVFTLTINSDGTYTYEQLLPLDHAEGTETDDVISLPFCVKVTDGDGDEITVEFNVNIIDSNPLAKNDSNSVDEAVGEVSGNVKLNDTDGADVETSVTEVTFEGEKFTIPANGDDVVIEGEYGTLTINKDGLYTYNVTASNPPAGSEVFGYTLTDADGDSDTAILTITLNIVNDQPEFSITNSAVDEENFDGGNLEVSGTVTADFGADGPGTIRAGGLTPSGLTSGGQVVSVTNDDNGYIATNENGETVFTLILNGDGTYTYEQSLPLDHAEGTTSDEAFDLNFGVIAKDDDGEETDGIITITVSDDQPVAKDDFNRFDSNARETSGNVIAGENGSFDDTDTDVDNLSFDTANTVKEVNGEAVASEGITQIEGTYGTLNIAADGSYTYELFDTSIVTTSSPYEFSNKQEFPVLNEREPITDPDIFGINAKDLDINFDATGSVQFVSEGAGYNNTFGQFYIDKSGNIVSADVIIENINDVDGKDIVTNFNVDGATREGIGFFIIADGFDTNNSFDDIDFENGILDFVFKFDTAEQREAKITDNGGDISLVYTAENGEKTVLQGPVYFTTERGGSENLNADNSVRVISGLVDESDPTVLRIGFEDLPNLGDKDFNDVVFDVTIQQRQNNKLVDNFEYTLQDFDGDTSVATLTICAEDLIDSKPVLTTTNKTVDETDFDSGNLEVTGVVDAEFGADGPGTITTNGQAPSDLTSNGQAVSIITSETGYTGQNEDGATVFTFVLNDNGTYTYTQLLALDHPDETDPDDAINLNFGVIAEDNNGDDIEAIIVITVKDDGPFAENVASSVYESDLRDGGVITETRRLPFRDTGADKPGTTEPSRFVAKYEVGGADVVLKSNNVDIDVQIVGNDFIGKAGDEVIFTLELNPSNSLHTFTQFAPIDHPQGTEVLWLKFYMNYVDADGDKVEVFSMFDVVDDAPVAEDDTNQSEDGTANGNVITGLNGGDDAQDDTSADISNTITSVNGAFVSASGVSEVAGAFGTLFIDANGQYTYQADVSTQTQTLYCFSATDPNGSSSAGNIDQVDMAYNETTGQFTFTMQVDDTADGFTLAVNNGPNPKGHAGELAMVYFDASNDEVDPIVSVYTYNGKNTQTSYQTEDRILSSETNANAFSSISVTTDLDGNKIMSFTVDASEINSFDPKGGEDNDWTGLLFDESVGVWLHPVSGLETEYEDGFLTNWDPSAQSWYDTKDQHAIKKQIEPEAILEKFVYTLTDQDGDSDTATLVISQDTDDVKIQVADSGGNEALYGDVCHKDIFLFTGNAGNDNEIGNFDVDQDVLDLSVIIEGYDADTHAIADFVTLTESGKDTIVAIDKNGLVDGAQFENVVTIKGVTGLDLENLQTDGTLVA